MVKNKSLFYLLSFTWGLPMTIVGCIVAAVLLASGKKPKKWGYCHYFEVGEGWGGVSLGMVFLTSKNPSVHTRNHELGHSHQNCIYGPFMIIISLMSAGRYWYRQLKYYRYGLTPATEYDSAWYEGDASKTGTEFMKWYETIQND